jgi:hypothetical protein
MQELNMRGGSSTVSSRTAKITFYAKVTLDKIKIPITLGTTTSYAKSATVTITIGDNNYSETASFEKTETGEREIEFSIGVEIAANTDVTIAFKGTRASINYGASTPYSIGAQAVVTSNSFEATLYVTTYKLWSMSGINDGYAYVTEFTVDDDVFDGYNPPKPPNSWKVGTANDGYPYTWGFTEITPTDSQAYLKTDSGLIPQTIFLKTETGLIPLTFEKIKG